ncbi:MAG: phosphodiester glycosidase family protein [Legionellales bacterium]|nr:phosphodiester glycosidase family protein [Legionellales bacterium]
MHIRIQDYIPLSHPLRRLKCCTKWGLWLFAVIIGLSTTSTVAHPWREVAPGVEYLDLSKNLITPWSHVHVFRINLKVNQLDVVMAHGLSQVHASADEFAHHSNALITINGGFFDRNFRPLGLRISSLQQQSPLKRISWWDVFYIKNKKPFITSGHQFNQGVHVEFAVQSGPRLLINGHIPSLKPGLAERSALGISLDDRVIILVTENAPITTSALAELMHNPPLNCENALNLDGGSSSQLHAHFRNFQIQVHGFTNVSDAIVVKGRR